MLAEIAHGGDPAADKRQARIERQARAALPTVAEALAAWRGDKAANWSPRYAAEVERLCGKFIEPVLGKWVLRETARTHWVGMIVKQRAKRPSTATWLYQIASAFLGHAEAHRLIPTFPLPRHGLSAIAPKGAARQRALDDNELRQVWLASAQLAPKARCFARLLIMTACRVSEAAGIAVGELDLTAARWTIPGRHARTATALLCHCIRCCSPSWRPWFPIPCRILGIGCSEVKGQPYPESVTSRNGSIRFPVSPAGRCTI